MFRLTCLLFVILVSCSPAGTVEWLAPRPGETLSGKVLVEVKSRSDPPAPNALFYVDGQSIGKVALERERFSIVWDTSGLEAGWHTLEVRPFGEASSRIKVEVGRAKAPVDVSPEPPAPVSLADPFHLEPWFELLPGFGALLAQVPPGFAPSDAYPLATTALRLLADAPLLLPRGTYFYDDAAQAWRFEPHDEDAFRVRFGFLDAAGVRHEVEAVASFDATTVVETVGGGLREVPVDMSFNVTDNAQTVAEGSLQAAYLQPAGCGPRLEPGDLELTFDWFGLDLGDVVADQLGLEETRVEATSNLTDQGLTLNASLDVLTDEGASGQVLVDLGVDGTVQRDAYTPVGFDLAELRTRTEVSFTADELAQGSVFTLRADTFTTEPPSAVVGGNITAYATGSDDEVTAFAGLLDASEGAVGTQVEVVLPNGALRRLDLYLTDLFGDYLKVFDEHQP